MLSIAAQGKAARRWPVPVKINRYTLFHVREDPRHPPLWELFNIGSITGMNGQRATMSHQNDVRHRRITTRWTAAAGACFASNLVRRWLRECAPPGELKRWSLMIDCSLSGARVQNTDWALPQKSDLLSFRPGFSPVTRLALKKPQNRFNGLLFF